MYFGAVEKNCLSLQTSLKELSDTLAQNAARVVFAFRKWRPYLTESIQAAREVLSGNNVVQVGRVSTEQASAWMQRANYGHSRNTSTLGKERRCSQYAGTRFARFNKVGSVHPTSSRTPFSA